MKTDLHLHSHVSDGLLSPSEVVRAAAERGFELIALTDHNTVDGIPEAAAEAERRALHLVPGVEMTASEGIREEHVLGYFIDPVHPGLRNHCRRTCEALRARLEETLERLAKLGFRATMEEVAERAGNPPFLDRPHVARLMKERGFVAHFGDAFSDYLADGAPAHVPLGGARLDETIQVILDAGGLPTLAHPKFFDYPLGGTEETVAPLVACGLRGIEVYHTCHSPEETARFQRIAERFDLIITGGSDCHGKPGEDGLLEMDRGTVPEGLGAEFLRRAEQALDRAVS